MSARQQSTDYLIVGQGIAGTVLALTLLMKGKRVMVIDSAPQSSSSLVAGGIYNPVTGKRLIKSWKAELLFPKLLDFYAQAELLLNVKLLHPVPVYIPFQTIADQNRWHAEADEPKAGGFVHILPPGSTGYPLCRQDLGGMEMLHSGYVDAKTLIHAFREYARAQKMYLQATLNADDIRQHPHGVEALGIQASHLIFCEGVAAMHNPYFGFLPFTPTKGELLLLYIEGLNARHIINTGGLFLIPQGDDRYLAGSTYDRDNLNDRPTEAAKNEILDKAEKLLGHRPAVLSHVAGVRPTVRSRRPFLGFHPQHPRLGIFNGLGTKGISLAPHFAEMLVNHAETGSPLEYETDVLRLYEEFLETR